jgi:hypothetical protein
LKFTVVYHIFTMVQCNKNHGEIVNLTPFPLIRRLGELPIPAADRASAIAEFQRAERLLDDVAELVAAVSRRFDPSSQTLKLRTAAR